MRVAKLNTTQMTRGVNSKMGCFRRKTKFFRESVQCWEIFQETQSNEVKILGSLRFFGNVSQKCGTILQIFGMTFSTHGSVETAFVRAVTPHTDDPCQGWSPDLDLESSARLTIRLLHLFQRPIWKRHMIIFGI